MEDRSRNKNSIGWQQLSKNYKKTPKSPIFSSSSCSEISPKIKLDISFRIALSYIFRKCKDNSFITCNHFSFQEYGKETYHKMFSSKCIIVCPQTCKQDQINNTRDLLALWLWSTLLFFQLHFFKHLIQNFFSCLFIVDLNFIDNLIVL